MSDCAPKKRGRKPKLTKADVVEIKRMYANTTDPIGWSIPAIARVFGVSTATVNKAINGTVAVSDPD